MDSRSFCNSTGIRINLIAGVMSIVTMFELHTGRELLLRSVWPFLRFVQPIEITCPLPAQQSVGYYQV